MHAINRESISSPSDNSAPKMSDFAADTLMQWVSVSSLRLKLIRAEMTPILARPSQVITNSGRFSRNIATTSP